MCDLRFSEMSDSNLWCISGICVYTGIAGLLLAFFLYKYIAKRLEDKLYEQFQNTPKDTVVIHCFQRIDFPSNIPTPQPWVQKIQLFCKFAKIPYIMDYENPWGPVGGKSPWITLNGQHMGDSQLIVEFLQRKFKVTDVFATYKAEEMAVARAVRVMLEERFFWAMPLWRFIWDEGKSHFLRDFSCLKLPFFYPVWAYRLWMGRHLGAQANAHGVSRHSKADIIEMMSGDLRAVSSILGDKTYILGDKPCMDDCSIFGFIAQAAYGMPGSPYDNLFDEELVNLKEYARRIKEEFFPEWKF